MNAFAVRSFLQSIRGFRAALVLATAVGLAGCANTNEPVRQLGEEAQIHYRVSTIREALRARNAAEMLRYAAPDWSYVGPDKVKLGRAAFLARTSAALAQVVAVESVELKVDRLVMEGKTTWVNLTQTTVWSEREAATGRVVRVWQQSAERQEWVREPDGWFLRLMETVGAPVRKELPAG